MSATLTILDPIAPAGIAGGKHIFHPLETLKGKVVGFIDNAKPNFNHLVDDVAELLVGKYGVKTVIKRRKRGASIPADACVVKELAAQCDVVITGSGD